MDDPRIRAVVEARRPRACSLLLDRPLTSRRVRFPSPESAVGSPLAEALFAIEGVDSVRIDGDRMTITRRGRESWRRLASKAGEAIRAHLRGGSPAVSESAPDASSDEELRASAEAYLAEEKGPSILKYGGRLEVEVRDGCLFFRMIGGCAQCADLDYARKFDALSDGIRRRIPEIDEIINLTEHCPEYAKCTRPERRDDLLSRPYPPPRAAQ
jgi:Fe-S cluster biogenesis protein NfuA